MRMATIPWATFLHDLQKSCVTKVTEHNFPKDFFQGPEMISEFKGAPLIKMRSLGFYSNCASKINIWNFRGRWCLRSSWHSGKGSSEKPQGISSEGSRVFAHCGKKERYCHLQTRHLPPYNQARKGHGSSPKRAGLWQLSTLLHPEPLTPFRSV